VILAFVWVVGSWVPIGYLNLAIYVCTYCFCVLL